jgi:hypothetical protein
MKQNKVFRMTKLKLSELVEDLDKQMPIRALVQDMGAAKAKATRALREYQCASAEVMQKTNEVLLRASEFSRVLEQEPMAFVYEKDDDVIFEIPFTEKDVRNAFRMQKLQMNKQAEQDEDQGGGEMYEDEDDK